METNEVIQIGYNTFVLNIVTTIVGILMMAGAVIAMWFKFINKLRDMDKETSLKINSQEERHQSLQAAVNELKMEHVKDVKKVEADQKELAIRIDGNMHDLRKENREEHSKLFETLGKMSDGISGMSASLRIHLEHDKQRQ